MGTPHKQAHEEERWLSRLTRKVRDDKYDLNQFNGIWWEMIDYTIHNDIWQGLESIGTEISSIVVEL